MTEIIETPIEDELTRVLLIQTSRVYDVLLAMYGEMNPQKAHELMELHAAGGLIGPNPAILEVTEE